MDASQVKKSLSKDDIISLLVELGAEPKMKGPNVMAKTICHGGGSHKLVYYPNKQIFRCYTDCGCTYDVFSLVEKAMGYDFFSSLKYICAKFGIVATNSQVHSPIENELKFLKNYPRKHGEEYEIQHLNKKIMNAYYNLHHQAWIDEGISNRSMDKFNIRFSIADNQIIIPHYDIDGNLIGVRARNMDKKLIEAGLKYIPVRYRQEFLRHPTGAALYGLNFNLADIQKYKKIILFESEKSVMQLDTIWPDKSIGACVSGSALSQTQAEIIIGLGVDEVIVGFDKEFSNEEEALFYAEKLNSTFAEKLGPSVQISYLWDKNNLLELKDSPTDKGLEVFEKLWSERIDIYQFSSKKNLTAEKKAI